MGAAVAATTSCDAGKRSDQATLGPPILVLGVNVGDGRPLPADGAVQVAFDRYLLPASVNRQSIAILDGANDPLPSELAPIVLYDPVARTVTLAPPRFPWLTEGQPYKVVLGIPAGDADLGGVRAIDRATLLPDQKREFAFFVGPSAGVPLEPAISFCRDVLPIFAAKCNLPTCHGSGEVAAAGLVLDTSAGVSATALGRIAQGANSGGRSGPPPPPGRLFGEDMPLVDPGNPGNSWLLYKVELARPPVSPAPAPRYACTKGLTEPAVNFAFAPLVPEAQRSASERERAALSDHILGREMPFPSAGASAYENEALTFEEREKIRLWIQRLAKGASVEECGGCGIVPAADAGAPDASADASDASAP